MIITICGSINFVEDIKKAEAELKKQGHEILMPASINDFKINKSHEVDEIIRGNREKYLKERQYIKAITFFDRSIHWYTPFNPYVWNSAERLWEISEYGEQQGDIKLALIACRTVRGGFYAASHFVVPGKKWIERCESKIDQLVKIEEKTEEKAVSIESEKKLLLQSQKTKTPDVFWSIILEIGFFGWVLSAIGFILFAMGRQKEKNYSKVPTFLWVGFILIFFGLWIAGMMKA